MPSPEEAYLAQFSVENLIRQATQPAETLRLPAEYAQSKPDMLGMQADEMLAAMAGPQPTAQGNPAVPYTQANYMGQGTQDSAGNAALPSFQIDPKLLGQGAPAIPTIGKDFSLGDVTGWIKARESTNNYTALNKEKKGNTASGAYQYTDATWNGYGGYAKAMLAPPHIQDRKFQEDIAARAKKFGGDPYKMIAAHYLPAAASDPSKWSKPYKLPNGQVVKPVASYVAYITKGTPLEKGLHAYLARQQ